jgi:hypothetical protein
MSILAWNWEGTLINLEGHAKLKAMQKNGDNIPNIILMPFVTQKEALFFMLNWLLKNKEGNNLNYSLIINRLLDLQVSRKAIIESTNKSKSWVSKVSSLSNNLNSNIIDLINKKVLSERMAEPISRLPQEQQLEFTNNVINDKLNKNQVEKLVSHYINENTPFETKEEIIKCPYTAIKSINGIESRKNRSKVKKDQITSIKNIFRFTLKHLEITKKTINELNAEQLLINRDFLEEIADISKEIFQLIHQLI